MSGMPRKFLGPCRAVTLLPEQVIDALWESIVI